MNLKEREIINFVNKGTPAKVREILKMGVNPNLKLNNGDRLIHLAVLNNRSEVVIVLLAGGAKIDIRNKTNDTPLSLFLAQTRSKKPDVAVNLLKRGANPNIKRTRNSWSPLHWAVFRNWSEVVQLIIYNGGQINEQNNKNGDTPLHLVTSQVIGKTLLSSGAKLNQLNKEGLDAFEMVLSKFNISNDNLNELKPLCQILIEHGTNVNKIGPDGFSVLMIAMNKGLEFISLLLIEAGADLTYTDQKVGAVIHVAASMNMPNILSKILNSGVDPNLKKSNGGYTPLHFAVANNQFENVKLLMAARADPSISNDYGQDALALAKIDSIIDLLKK